MASDDGTQTRAIRVGLIYDGEVVDERVVESPGPVSVGEECGATLSTEAEAVPDRFDLFDWTGGEYVLRLRPEMTGRVRTPEGLEELDTWARRADTETGGAARVSVDRVSQGRVVMGEAVVLFQRVRRSSSAEGHSMPAELKRGFFGTVDGRLASAVAATALVQVGFVAWTQLQSWPSAKPQTLANDSIAIADEWSEAPTPVERENPRKTSEKQPPQASQESEDSGESDSSADDSEPKQKRVSPEETTDEPGAEGRNVSDEAAREDTVLEALGSEDGEGMLADMETTSPGGAFDEALAEGRAGGSDSSEGMLETGGRSGTEEEGKTVGGAGLEAAPGSGRAGGGMETGARAEVGVRCEDCDVEPEPPDPDAPGLDAGSILEQYQGRIRACYERVLKQGKTSGKVVVSFRVGPEGHPRAVRMDRDSVDERVATCVVGVVRAIDFPAPGERTRRISKAFVFEPGG